MCQYLTTYCIFSVAGQYQVDLLQAVEGVESAWKMRVGRFIRFYLLIAVKGLKEFRPFAVLGRCTTPARNSRLLEN